MLDESPEEDERMVELSHKAGFQAFKYMWIATMLFNMYLLKFHPDSTAYLLCFLVWVPGLILFMHELKKGDYFASHRDNVNKSPAIVLRHIKGTLLWASIAGPFMFLSERYIFDKGIGDALEMSILIIVGIIASQWLFFIRKNKN